jgi:hypothetical protein
MDPTAHFFDHVIQHKNPKTRGRSQHSQAIHGVGPKVTVFRQNRHPIEHRLCRRVGVALHRSGQRLHQFSKPNRVGHMVRVVSVSVLVNRQARTLLKRTEFNQALKREDVWGVREHVRTFRTGAWEINTTSITSHRSQCAVPGT